jgi:hypothetical protein
MMGNKLNLSGRQIFYIFLGIWGFLNIIQALFTPLHNDEAYYWMFSRYPAWGYYDHPPMIAMLIGAGYLIFSNELGVRLMVVLSQIATLLIVWSLLDDEKKESPANALLIIMVIAILPVLNIYGFLATPDPPLLLFTALFLLFYRRFLRDENWLNTLVLGFTMAGLMYSKYHGAIMLILIILSNLKLFKSPKFYIASIFALLLFLPHISWQVSNGFPSFQYHLSDRASGFDPSHIAEYLVNQLLIHNPLLLPLFLFIFFKTKSNDVFEKGLKYTVTGFFIFFLISSFRYHVEPQWTALITIPLLILVFNSDTIYGKNKYIRIVFLVLVPIFLFARFALMIDFLPVSFLKKEFHRHRKWASDIENLAGERPVVFTNSYQDPSVYSFYTGQFAHSLDNKDYRKTQYDIWPFEEQVHGKEVLYVPHWLNDFYRERLSIHVRPDGDTMYYRIFKDFRSLQKECVIPDHDSWSFSNSDENSLDLSIFNLYSYDIDITHPEFPVVFQTAIYNKDGSIVMKRNIDIQPGLEILYPGDTVSVTGRFSLNGLQEGEYDMVICTETGILYDVFSSVFREVIVMP